MYYYNYPCLVFVNTIFFFIFYWGRVALQSCVGFCCITKWIRHTYPYIPSPLRLPSCPHSSPSSHHLGHHRPPCALEQLPTSCLLYAWECICPSQPPSSPHPPTPPCPHVYSLHLHLYSRPANRFICTIFLIPISALIYNIYFSLSDLPHSVWQALDPATYLHMTQLFDSTKIYFVNVCGAPTLSWCWHGETMNKRDDCNPVLMKSTF